jgi:hemolysin III
MLLASTRDAQSAGLTAVYALSLVGMFGISALYHRPQWGESAKRLMRRLDHATIFILIAGTCTPISWLALRGEAGMKLLSIVWITAFVGIFQALFWPTAPKWVSIGLYILCGWSASPYILPLADALGTFSLTCLVIGGVIYTLGAAIYALKKPNPFPKIFGYHELFHLLVIIAATFHFVVIARLVG